ncbi:unnamed protein product [Caenorhabditis sp. 36 PRJEB53466]|nr:unnamed protein product [Caenorhabditis sp. 36 PRJEB53466]
MRLLAHYLKTVVSGNGNVFEGIPTTPEQVNSRLNTSTSLLKTRNWRAPTGNGIAIKNHISLCRIRLIYLLPMTNNKQSELNENSSSEVLFGLSLGTRHQSHGDSASLLLDGFAHFWRPDTSRNENIFRDILRRGGTVSSLTATRLFRYPSNKDDQTNGQKRNPGIREFADATKRIYQIEEDHFCTGIGSVTIVTENSANSSNTCGTTSEAGARRCLLYKFDFELKPTRKKDDLSILEMNFKHTKLTDVILFVDGKQMHVNRNFLSVHSDYFRACFSSEFKETSMNEIPIEDVDYENFARLLSTVYPYCSQPTLRQSYWNSPIDS